MTEPITYAVPGLLFPAITLVRLAFTNRYIALASVVRQLISPHGIGRGNSLALFPRYREPGEPVDRPTEFGPLSSRSRVRRALTRPLVALAEHLRDR